jgi:hypothetical protein
VSTGQGALFSNTTGNLNTAIGSEALFTNTIGSANTACGEEALRNNNSGGGNTAIGAEALHANISGELNTALGYFAGVNVTTGENVICISYQVVGSNVSNSCYIGNIWNQPGGTQAVYVNSEGKIGQMVSSRRFKDEVKPMEKASEAIYALKPVSFRYKAEIESSRPRGYGLIAEDVEKVSSDLITRDADGQAQSVCYDAVNAMLLNEFLKEHRKNEVQGATITALRANDAKQEATIAQQQKQIDALGAALQKVSAQLELSKAAPQTVLNNQ